MFMQGKSGLYTALLPGSCRSLLQPPSSWSSTYDHAQARTTITM